MWIRKGDQLINLDKITMMDFDYRIAHQQCRINFLKGNKGFELYEYMSFSTGRPERLAAILEDKITDALRKGLPVLELSDGDDEYSI